MNAMNSSIPESGDREIQKTAFLTELRTIKGENLDPFSAAYPFTNDRNVASLIPDIKNHHEETDANLNIGMVIGTGGLFTLGKELPDIDVWIVIDRRLSMIDAMESWEDYLTRTTSYQTAKNVTFTSEAQGCYNIERESYGDYHYFSSQEEYTKMRDFLAKKKIVYVPGDLLDEQYMNRIGVLLKQYGAKITFVNMTNVAQWIMKDTHGDSKLYRDRLNCLPFDENCYILYSQQDVTQPERPLYAKGAVGVIDYLTTVNKSTEIK